MILKIVKVVEETPSVRTLRFDLAGNKLMFVPGQFVMVTVPVAVGGVATLVKRAFSISSSPLDEGFIEITVKREANGVASPVLCNAKVGDAYGVAGPYGLFKLDEAARDVVFLAAGSGVAPLMAMIRTVLRKGLPVEMVLVYSNRTEEEIIFRQELESLVVRHQNFRCVFTVTREEQIRGDARKGRVDEQLLREVVPSVEGKFFYLCGPEPFMHAMLSYLEKLRVEKEKIKKEVWG